MNKARSALAGAYLLWGAGIVANKLALVSMPFYLLGLIRFGVATGVVGKKPLQSLLQIRGAKVHLLVLHAIFSVTQMASFFLAISLMDGTLFSIVTLLIPLAIYNFSVFYLHERRDKHLLIGSLIALSGSLIAVAYSSDFTITSNVLALVAAMVNILSDSAATVMSKKLSTQISKDQISGLYHGANFIFYALLTLIMMPELNVSDITLTSWLGAVWATVVSTIICWNLYIYGVKKVKATEISLFVYLAPIAGVVASMLVLKESASPMFWVGSGVVVLGVIYAERLMILRVPNLFRHRYHHHH